MAIGRFIAGVGALIWEPKSEKYLFLRRSAEKDFGAGAWECVTGRVDQGESFEEALYREVREELDIDVVVDAIIGTTHFYRGEPMPANELLGVMYLCSRVDSVPIKMSIEHDAHAWLSVAEAHGRFADSAQNQWLLRALDWAEALRNGLPPELLAAFRTRGFGLNSF